jgi:hemoglobin/transferrin/lactoferrin receptor protein
MITKYSKILVISIILFYSAIVNSQTVYVFDQQTGEPISNVFVYSSDQKTTTITNSSGIADLSEFAEDEKIIFQHTSYYLLTTNKHKLKRQKFSLGLNENFVKLSEVVVSASKWEENTTEIPNKIAIIKKKDIIFDNPQTSADMLSNSGEVYVQKSQLGGGSPMLRGFAANSILLIVDGVRMNNAIYRSGNLQNVLQADVNSLENTEIIFGPGTNIYGSDALGGVIDFHLISPEFSNSKKWLTKGSASARFATTNFERTLHADLNSANDKWAFAASFSFSSFDDLKMGTKGNEYLQRNEYVNRVDGKDSVFKNEDPDLQKFSGYNQMNFTTKLSNRFSKNINWTYSLYLSNTSDVPRYDRLLQEKNGKPKYAEWFYSPQQWVMNSLKLGFHNKTKAFDQAEIIFAYQNVKEGRNDRKLNNDWLRERTESVNILSANADFDKQLNVSNIIFYGLEFIYNDIVSEGLQRNILSGERETVASRYPDGGNKYYHSGVYASYKKNFLKTPVTFQAGIRYSFVSLSSKFIDTSFYKLPYKSISLNNDAFTASTGIVYRPGQWQLSFNLSSGFRAPNLDDVAKIFDSEPGNVVVPNENLKPEYLYNSEISIHRSFNSKSSIQLTGFYSYLNNAMVRRDYTLNGADSIMYDGEMSKVQAVVNASYATIYGGSLLIKLQLAKYLRFKTTFSYIKGTDDSGDALRHAPPLYGISSLVFDQNRFKIEMSAAYNAAVTYENLAPSERDKTYMYATDENGNPWSPSWWVLNLRSSFAFNEKFMANIAIENILNQRYRPYSSGIAQEGRNFILSVRYSF